VVLFRDLATLRTDIALFSNIDELCWQRPTEAFAALAEQFDRAVLATGTDRVSRRSGIRAN
jgi:hypothetical protein